MITFYDILKLLDSEAELEVLNFEGNLLQDGVKGSTLWEDSLLEKRIYKVIPGIVTKILLDSEY